MDTPTQCGVEGERFMMVGCAEAYSLFLTPHPCQGGVWSIRRTLQDAGPAYSSCLALFVRSGVALHAGTCTSLGTGPWDAAALCHKAGAQAGPLPVAQVWDRFHSLALRAGHGGMGWESPSAPGA